MYKHRNANNKNDDEIIMQEIPPQPIFKGTT
jgi:hypothetical protein